MLKKINRISSRGDFLEVKENGEMISTPLFGALVIQKKDEFKKFGFVISKKISKRAVDRNKIKRRLAEIIKKDLENFEKGIRVVFLVKRDILDKKIEEIENEVKKCLKK